VFDKNILTASAQGHDKMETLYKRHDCMWLATIPIPITILLFLLIQSFITDIKFQFAWVTFIFSNINDI